jgi:short-subunit dehydrogenase
VLHKTHVTIRIDGSKAEMADKPVCVVVGVGPGIGLAVAKKFAKEKYTVVMLARRQSALSKYIQTLNEMGADGYAYPADASDENNLSGVFAQVQNEIGTVNVLVYNVAAIKQGAPTQLSSQDLQEDFKVNVNGALVSAQQVIPKMKERKSGTLRIALINE